MLKFMNITQTGHGSKFEAPPSDQKRTKLSNTRNTKAQERPKVKSRLTPFPRKRGCVIPLKRKIKLNEN